ncbi:VVA0879 family protein [Streptosporangium sp. CA-115845]|uniref:VVA0879 family protein n=1 Tax=Streptosporangium sp. CA-115845 TaxID=3240071 RepID=UPI003D935CB6
MSERFRNRPFEVTAIQWVGESNCAEVFAFVGLNHDDWADELDHSKLHLPVLEGDTAVHGDWLVKYADGAVKVMKPSEFEAGFEKVSSILSNAEWRAEGTRRFGKDAAQWKFRCPACGNVASASDFIALGVSGHSAPHGCIGGVQVELGGLPGVKHCKYHVSDLPRLPEVIKVEGAAGDALLAFPFAEAAPASAALPLGEAS